MNLLFKNHVYRDRHCDGHRDLQGSAGICPAVPATKGGKIRSALSLRLEQELERIRRS
jgi:hypothetical protein